MRLPVTVRAALAAGAAALLVILVPAQPAWAHAQLVKTDPAKGSTVSAPLTAVTLTFNEMVKQQFSTVVVTGADGVSYSDGTPRSVDKTLTQTVKPLPTGAVTVVWHTVSPDGDAIDGRFTFTNAAAPPAPSTAPPSSPAAPPTSAAAATSAAPTVAAEPASDDDGGSSGLIWAVAGGVLLLALLAGGAVWRRRRGAA